LPIPPGRLRPRPVHRDGNGDAGNGKPARDYVEPADPAWFLYVLTLLPLGVPMLAVGRFDYPLWKGLLVTALCIGLVAGGLGVTFWRAIRPLNRAVMLMGATILAYSMLAVDVLTDPPPRPPARQSGPDWQHQPTRPSSAFRPATRPD
jgi:hypothetical protein